MGEIKPVWKPNFQSSMTQSKLIFLRVSFLAVNFMCGINSAWNFLCSKTEANFSNFDILNFSSHNFLQVYLCLASSVLKCHTCTPLLFQMVQESLRNWLNPPSFLPKPGQEILCFFTAILAEILPSEPSHPSGILILTFPDFLLLPASVLSTIINCIVPHWHNSLPLHVVIYLNVERAKPIVKWASTIQTCLESHAAVSSPTSLLYLSTLLCQSSKIWNQNHLTSSSKTQVWIP